MKPIKSVYMKKNYFLNFFLILMFLLGISCKNPAIETAGINFSEKDADIAEAKNEVISAGETFVIAINTGDYIGAANCYTNDAKIMRPNIKSIIG